MRNEKNDKKVSCTENCLFPWYIFHIYFLCLLIFYKKIVYYLLKNSILLVTISISNNIMYIYFLRRKSIDKGKNDIKRAQSRCYVCKLFVSYYDTHITCVHILEDALDARVTKNKYHSNHRYIYNIIKWVTVVLHKQ